MTIVEVPARAWYILRFKEREVIEVRCNNDDGHMEWSQGLEASDLETLQRLRNNLCDSNRKLLYLFFS